MACTGLLVGNFNRRGQNKIISVSIISMVAVQAGDLIFGNLAAKYLYLLPLMYLNFYCLWLPAYGCCCFTIRQCLSAAVLPEICLMSNRSLLLISLLAGSIIGTSTVRAAELPEVVAGTKVSKVSPKPFGELEQNPNITGFMTPLPIKRESKEILFQRQ